MAVVVRDDGGENTAQLLFYGAEELLCHLSMYDGTVAFVDD